MDSCPKYLPCKMILYAWICWMLYEKVKIVIAVIAMLIVVVSGTSTGFAIPNVQATSDDGNVEQTFAESGTITTAFTYQCIGNTT